MGEAPAASERNRGNHRWSYNYCASVMLSSVATNKCCLFPVSLIQNDKQTRHQWTSYEVVTEIDHYQSLPFFVALVSLPLHAEPTTHQRPA